MLEAYEVNCPFSSQIREPTVIEQAGGNGMIEVDGRLLELEISSVLDGLLT